MLRRLLAPVVLLLSVLGGCSAAIAPMSSPEPSPIGVPALPAASAPADVAEAAPAPPEPPLAPSAPAPTGGTGVTSDALLGYFDAVANLPAAELAQEIRRLGDPGDSAPHSLRLAIALAQTRNSANIARVQALLRRVLANDGPEAKALHPLARLLGAHAADARRYEDQVERQSQQLRDALRRIDQLNDRLEAVRAIERSLPSRPASAPAANPR